MKEERKKQEYTQAALSFSPIEVGHRFPRRRNRHLLILISVHLDPLGTNERVLLSFLPALSFFLSFFAPAVYPGPRLTPRSCVERPVSTFESLIQLRDRSLPTEIFG